MLLRQSVPITPETTAATLHDALAAIGASLILDALTSAPPPVPQREADATYAPKLSREDGLIDWSNPATAIDRQIRAFDPWPRTFTTIAGVPLKVLAAKPVDGTGEPGAVLDANLTVACGGGAVRLTRVQLPGRGALAADAFLRGHAVPPGTVLGR
jgi:methionyl-tRNA formyltransferase